MPKSPVPIEQRIEFNDVVLVLTTERSLEQVHYKGDVVISVSVDEIVVLHHAGPIQVHTGYRPGISRLDDASADMQALTHFNGVWILLTTERRHPHYLGECNVILSVHKEEVRVLTDSKVVGLLHERQP